MNITNFLRVYTVEGTRVVSASATTYSLLVTRHYAQEGDVARSAHVCVLYVCLLFVCSKIYRICLYLATRIAMARIHMDPHHFTGSEISCMQAKQFVQYTISKPSLNIINGRPVHMKCRKHLRTVPVHFLQ